MKSKIVLGIALSIILISFIIGIALYGQMPEQMASHWNAKGEVNGYMPKFWGIFLMPFVSLILLFIFLLIPRIDPLKNNIKMFRSYFDGFILLLVIYFFYIYILTLLPNLGYNFNMTLTIFPAIAVLFYYLGVLLEHTKRNWFIGIRTPWTLSNELVWNKTHKLASKLFKLFAVIMLVGVFFPDYFIWIILGVIVPLSLYLILYSYLEYKKLKRK
jgi:uncharacterized membrane protein